MEYPEQTIKRLTQRLGRAPTPEEIKSERDMLIRAAYGSMLLAEISFADEVCANKTATARSCRRSSSWGPQAALRTDRRGLTVAHRLPSAYCFEITPRRNRFASGTTIRNVFLHAGQRMARRAICNAHLISGWRGYLTKPDFK
jgi:hypothetical protein